MAELTFFELSDVADLLQLSISTVKNWTIGRPLSIKPSIRASQGKGSRNLYSREDVYVLALAAQLSRDGFAIKTVQDILDKQIELKNRLKEVGKETLGKKADELTPEQKKKLDDIAKEQKDKEDKERADKEQKDKEEKADL